MRTNYPPPRSLQGGPEIHTQIYRDVEDVKEKEQRRTLGNPIRLLRGDADGEGARHGYYANLLGVDSSLPAIMASNQEGHLESLLLIQAWVTEAGVVEREVLLS